MGVRSVLVIGAIAIALATVCTAKLQQKYSWKEIEYEWPTAEAEQEAIKSGAYKQENNLPLGLDKWRNKMFITVPRWKAGVASSLNYIDLSDEQSPKFHPYPSWEANTLPKEAVDPQATESSVDRLHAAKATKTEYLTENNTIISTFRIRVDECDRLWVIDTGLADILGSPKQITPPSLVIFDLNTDELIRRFAIPEDAIKEDSFFANIIVDVQKSDCSNAYAYLPDLGAYAVVVYSLSEDKAWRVKHNFFHFDPLQGDYNVGGVNFQWTDGVFGMALGSVQPDNSRPVYFHALSSTREFVVSNLVLQNETLATDPSSYYAYKVLGERGQNGQATASFYDEATGVLFYTQVNKDSIGCWNTKSPYFAETQGLVDSDSDALVFPNDLKVDNEGTLWVLSDRMPLFLYKNLKAGEYNYRILRGRTQEIIQGTPCHV